MSKDTVAEPIAFKAETRQLLDILIHSLYTEREIFLRELISNASDALTRMDFELLTNREVLDPDAELVIRLIPDKQKGTLTVQDNGIGMSADELVTNLGTIAQSGAREFIQAAQGGEGNLNELIGQFGVGFYSAFMVAEWVRVVSRSHDLEAEAATWYCIGDDTFTVEPAEMDTRGTQVIVKLKEDALEFLEEARLREVVRKHSDFIPFPIYIGSGEPDADDSVESDVEEGEERDNETALEEQQVNRQTAIWRQSPREVEEKDYNDFYQQLTLDFEPPLAHAHMIVDAPVQMYALLYLPSDPERGMFSLRREEGLKLYARKVLIQEYTRDLLPEYLGFVQGVVDSEDLPLNVSRESVQSNRVMAQLRRVVTNKVIDTLEKLAKDDAEKYAKFWEGYARFIKHGIATEMDKPEKLYPLLRFRTTKHPDEWSSLDDYVERIVEGQEKIYYIMGDDEHSVMYSPHLDVVRKYDYEVLILSDPIDAFMLVRLNEYKDRELSNVATANLALPEVAEGADGEESPELPEEGYGALIERFKDQLGERVTDVRMTDRLSDSPARLVDPEGALNQEMQRVYRLLERDFEVPKKVLELNPRHPILVGLNALPEEDERTGLVIEQIYEDALLIEGLHPDPASMIQRIQKLIEKALV